MIVRTKPLKIKRKETQTPLEDFMLINENDNYSVTKEVLFVRYIGIPNSIEDYIENILTIDRYFSSSMSTSPYLRLHRLEITSNVNDINRLSNVWENWQTIVTNSLTDPSSLYQAPLCTQLDNDTLEWTKKLTFIQILSMYKEIYPNSNATLFKNFAIKFLSWLEIYLPKLFYSGITTSTSPKIVFIGDIKHHELLFLYFLSKLGCDICYMNPKEDIVNLYPEIKEYSTLYKCSTLYSDTVTIPDFLPTPNTGRPSLASMPDTISRSKIPTTAKPSSNLSKAEEFSYEQLAGFSNSVVMIKTYDDQNTILCSGSGVVIHSNGYILTNLHVLAGGHHFSVLYENETKEYITANFIKYHQQYDLAIIKVDKKCSALTVKTDDHLVRGQKIVAIGSPLGLFNSVSDGIVSGFRDIDSTPMIQFTAPISNGSSGGALLDMFGRLVGLITAGFNQGQNLNLAVPSQKIYQFAQNFIEHTN
ncbi:trypsin-like peptidase domain-containing protein [Desulforamulus aeronauticus]|uniref:Trypsin-like peptidase domain-containing protein n=1 Tax=Desulforamulus aeronauticus DSM 10349 TaxID=1121421 RepID=A0A1M6Q160_9FIRM|nr:trypsin-like peptidase domain-containing protein [Desulforamulus aeronauticus]SHK13871.1 Trypsin-like peptidase domain-containing protein [Desulforamulus aeronauticus DSM 10349]